MKDKARLIIPLWGPLYAEKLTSITLPALLAPGNLPALCAAFDLEVVIVTEQHLVPVIEASTSFRRVAELCRTKFAPLDDLMTGIPGDYGVVLTNALFRGFIDLGAAMTDTYLLFLNADFIIADGSYRRLAELMQEGHRVIHAPSFRVVLEDVWPKLKARLVDDALAMTPREMVKLALTHRHLTVKARTVNQRFYHQWRMDQFYWHVDEDTMIGYQWPVALVAIKPERVVTTPVCVWDYAFVPQAAPTLERYFIDDTDEFFMLEPQKRASGDEMIRLGWISSDEIAKDLSIWTTREQRDCGQQLFKIHAADLPPDLDEYVSESRRYIDDITRRLSPTPQPHIHHGMLGAWFDGAMERIAAKQAGAAPAQNSESAAPARDEPKGRSGVAAVVRSWCLPLLKSAYAAIFGASPVDRTFHPLWADTHDVITRVRDWQQNGKRILWVTAKDSFFNRLLSDWIDPASILTFSGAAFDTGPYDACLCEISPNELPQLAMLHGKLRDLVQDGGTIIVHVFNLTPEQLGTAQFAPFGAVFPDTDRSAIRFYGTALTARLRNVYFWAAQLPHNEPLHSLVTGLSLLALAPLCWIANRRTARLDPAKYSSHWTSAVLEFVVAKKPARLQSEAHDKRAEQRVPS